MAITIPDRTTQVREQTTTHGDDVREIMLEGHKELGDIDYSTHRPHKKEQAASEQDDLNQGQQLGDQQAAHPVLGTTQEYDGASTEEIEAMAIADQNDEAREKLRNEMRHRKALEMQQKMQMQQMTSPRGG